MDEGNHNYRLRRVIIFQIKDIIVILLSQPARPPPLYT